MYMPTSACPTRSGERFIANRNPRLRGYMRTDAQGRYEFSAIKPAPYSVVEATVA